MKKRILSILLAVCLVITMFPITALSLEEDGSGTTVQYTVLEGSGGFSGEGHENLFDGDVTTKWCVSMSAKLYVVFKTDSPVFVSGYDITTANDNDENYGRNPKSWTLYGCNDYTADGGSSWVPINSVTDDNTLQDFNYTKYGYVFEKETTAYQYYKLEITANQGAEVMQMSEFALTFCDHVWGEEIQGPATCTEDGLKFKSCNVCRNTLVTVIPKLGHTWVETGRTPATCTASGKITQKCSVCDATQSISDPDAPALGHTWVETARTPATCTASGKITQKCSVCDATQSISDPDAPALGHTWVETARTPATCTASGKITQKCSVCDATQSISDPDAPALGHNYSAETGICDRCGDDIRYTFDISKGRVTITSDENNPGMIKVAYGSGQTMDNVDPNTVLTVTGSTTAYELHVNTDIPVKIKAQDLTIDRSGTNFAYAMSIGGANDSSEVTLILEGTNTIKAGSEVSGICVVAGRTLIIEGDGSLNAVGGNYGAGIGGERQNTCGTVIINSGTVTATGRGGGAGIGGGGAYATTGGGGSVIINGGTVTANGNNLGSDIGGGLWLTEGICILLGGAVTATNGRMGTSSGIKVNEDGTLEVYGDLTLPADITVPEGKTLVIPSGATLTVPDGVTLTNNGTIINNNGFTNNGTVINNGTFINNGDIVEKNHTPEKDDGDCTTPVYCIFCGEIATPAMSHDFEWQSDGTYHWHECQNAGCTVKDEKKPHESEDEDGDCTTPIVCAVCGEILTPAMSHDFSGAWHSDDTSHWHQCKNAGCNQTDEKVAIAPERIEATIVNAEYLLDTTVKPTDITVTAYYSDGFSETVTTFTTDIDDIDMSTVGSKTVTVSLTKNGGTCTDDIIINVIEKKHNYVNGVCSGCGSYEPPELKNGVYQIKNYANLYWFAALVNGTLTDGTPQNTSANAVLVNDITVNSIANMGNYLEWTPIGNSDNRYAGTFDGQGHKITGLYFNDASAEYVGLFGCSDGTIKNVGVVGSYFNGKNGVGGVCGKNNGGIISNCYNTSAVNGVTNVGGIAGVNSGSACKINNCYNTGAISASDYGAGGIAGYSYYATIMNCYSSASISAPTDVGGICGASDYGTVNNCYHNSKYYKGNSVGRSNLGTEENVSAKTATQFTSGEVAYLLSGGVTDGTQVWYQTLGTDSCPTFDNTHGTVYYNVYYPGCVGAPGTPTYKYENVAGSNTIPPHSFVNGVCTICGEYEPAELADGVYQIKNAGNLFWFAALVNGDSTHADFDAQNTGASAVLTADIDLENREWKPIMAFAGSFDGQGHSVSNFKITSTTNYVGLFGSAYGTVMNFTLKGEITLSAAGDMIGGIVGYADGATVRNVASYVNISNTAVELKHVGGVVGYIENEETIVDKCVYYGNMNIQNSYDCIGGVVGYTNVGGRISNCANFGTVNASKDGAYVGGILGYVNNLDPTVKNCCNYGSVSNGGNSTYCGAVIGWARKYTVNNLDNNYYLNTSCSLGFGSASMSGATATAKTAAQFESGEVAFLLNNGVTDGTQAWYQTLGTDDYPTLDNTHGTVYYNAYYPGCVGAPGTPAYKYENVAGSEELPPHNFVDGICTICGAEQHIVIVEEDLHAEGLVLGANTAADCKAELNTAEMYVVIKNINGDALADSDLVGTGATITYYDRTTNAAVKTVTVVLYGDVNGDGLCDTTDYTILKDAANANAKLDNQWFVTAADITRDGAYDAYDAIALDLFLHGYMELAQKTVV
ncbi:MAG: dockerin type I repeat-containing protein [Candidatus Fimenecus sp.]